MIADVLDILLGDGTVSNPGYKPAGINLRVLGPTKVTVNVAVTVTDTGDVERTVIAGNIETVVSAYINGLEIGEDVVYNEVVQLIMGVVGVYDCVLSAPSANVSIGATQIARVGTFTVTFYSP
jgi:uncharacterized phage protein gp47/JayE